MASQEVWRRSNQAARRKRKKPAPQSDLAVIQAAEEAAKRQATTAAQPGAVPAAPAIGAQRKLMQGMLPQTPAVAPIEPPAVDARRKAVQTMLPTAPTVAQPGAAIAQAARGPGVTPQFTMEVESGKRMEYDPETRDLIHTSPTGEVVRESYQQYALRKGLPLEGPGAPVAAEAPMALAPTGPQPGAAVLPKRQLTGQEVRDINTQLDQAKGLGEAYLLRAIDRLETTYKGADLKYTDLKRWLANRDLLSAKVKAKLTQNQGAAAAKAKKEEQTALRAKRGEQAIQRAAYDRLADDVDTAVKGKDPELLLNTLLRMKTQSDAGEIPKMSLKHQLMHKDLFGKRRTPWTDDVTKTNLTPSLSKDIREKAEQLIVGDPWQEGEGLGTPIRSATEFLKLDDYARKAGMPAATDADKNKIYARMYEGTDNHEGLKKRHARFIQWAMKGYPGKVTKAEAERLWEASLAGNPALRDVEAAWYAMDPGAKKRGKQAGTAPVRPEPRPIGQQPAPSGASPPGAAPGGPEAPSVGLGPEQAPVGAAQPLIAAPGPAGGPEQPVTGVSAQPPASIPEFQAEIERTGSVEVLRNIPAGPEGDQIMAMLLAWAKEKGIPVK